MPARVQRSATVRINPATPEQVEILNIEGESALGGAPRFAGKRGGAGARIAFDVQKDLGSKANRATVTIYGLSRKTRERIAGMVRVEHAAPTMWDVAKYALRNNASPELVGALAGQIMAGGAVSETVYTNRGIAVLELYAGHGVAPGLIFAGLTETIQDVRQGQDVQTILASGDNVAAMRAGTISKEMGIGATLVDLIDELARHMGGSLSVAQKARIQALSVQNGRYDLPYGFAAYGNAYVLLTQLLAHLDLDWSFQDGQFLLLEPDGSLPGPPVPLRRETGLIGAPRRLGADAVEAVALLDAELVPGRKVDLKARDVSGAYRIQQTRFVGDTHQGQFAAIMQLTPMQVKPGLP